jgi:hypothetical protein
LAALNKLKGKVPDVLPAGTISLECRERLGVTGVVDQDVIALVTGLSILIPDLVGIEVDKIFVNASAERIAEAVRIQLEKLHSDETPET